jgi:hypothetical protein
LKTRKTKAVYAAAATIALVVTASLPAGAGATAPPVAAIAPPDEIAERVRPLPNGLFRVTTDGGYTFTTHGGDPAPDGHGASLGPGDPERDPVCATGHVQHILYGYPVAFANRVEQVKEEIRAHVRRMNAVLNEAAVESGNTTADFRVACDDAGQISVDAFPNTTMVPYITTIIDAARAAGYDDPDVDYNIFYDGDFPGVCGIAQLYRDSSPGEDNNNNSGGYAVTYESCWYSRTPMHENGHNQGAVQSGAPHEDGTNHCTEHEDIMCYPSSSLECPDQMYYDCGFDTYFDAAPEPGEWLDTHWNIGSRVNRYIVFGDVPAPVARLEGPAGAPRRGSRIRLTASLSDCTGREETAIELQRKTGTDFEAVSEETLDEDCSAGFTIKADFSSATFRSYWRDPDGGAGVASEPIRIRTRA